MRLQKRFQHFFADFTEMIFLPRYKGSAILAFVFLVLSAALPVWLVVPLREARPFIPLHYNIYFGVDRLGPWFQIFFIPGLACLLFILNLVLQTAAFRHQHFLATLISIATVLLNFVFLVAMVLIILLNASYAQ